MNTSHTDIAKWKSSNSQDFWGRVASEDHIIQFYESEKFFLDTLEGFAGSGLLAGERVIIIATRPHLDQLNLRLQHQGFDILSLINDEQYYPLDAHETLESFMVDNWPDEELFTQNINDLLQHARRGGKKIRGFGEMVAILWEEGNHEATAQLEKLWHSLHCRYPFSLYCAYPKSTMKDFQSPAFNSICASHSLIIEGSNGHSTEIHYHSLPATVS